MDRLLRRAHRCRNPRHRPARDRAVIRLVGLSPGWRVITLTRMSMVLMIVVSLLAAVKISESNTHRQIEREQQARAEGRRVTCDLVGRILTGYEEVPPPGETGKNVVEAWQEEYRILGCLPRK